VEFLAGLTLLLALGLSRGCWGCCLVFGLNSPLGLSSPLLAVDLASAVLAFVRCEEDDNEGILSFWPSILFLGGSVCFRR